MADSRSRTTLNLSNLSDRIERLRSDSAWRILPLSKKVTLILEEYLALIESGQVSDMKTSDSHIQPNTERDRITLDLNDLRERFEAVSTEQGQSLASIILWVSILGLDLLDICRRLQILPPPTGEMEKWLTEITNVEAYSEIPKSSQSVSLLKFLASLEKRPSNAEIVKAAARLRVDTEELMQVCDRLFCKKECSKDGVD